jgi:hypothetical protein
MSNTYNFNSRTDAFKFVRFAFPFYWVQRSPVIMEYAQFQQEAVNFLREINNEISELLGINFATFAHHATC